MFKRHNAFSGNLTIFFPNATKTQTVSKVELVRFWMNVFYRLYICNIYNIAAFVSDFKQLNKFYKFHPIK